MRDQRFYAIKEQIYNALANLGLFPYGVPVKLVDQLASMAHKQTNGWPKCEHDGHDRGHSQKARQARLEITKK